MRVFFYAVPEKHFLLIGEDKIWPMAYFFEAVPAGMGGENDSGREN